MTAVSTKHSKEDHELRLTVLGRIELKQGVRSLDGLIRRRKPLAVFAYLVLDETGRFFQRDHLCGVFWPETSQSRSRASLRQALSTIRRQLPDVFEFRGDEEVRVRPGVVSNDLSDLRLAAKEQRWADVRALDVGDPFQGFHVPGADGFEDWLSQIQLEVHAIRRQVPPVHPEGSSTGGEPSDLPAAEAVTMAAAPPSARLPDPGPKGVWWWGAAVLVAVMTISLIALGSRVSEPPLRDAIAVSTPELLGSTPGASHLAWGLQDELTAQLARVPGLTLVPARFVRAMEQDTTGSVQALAEALDARYGLDSSLQFEDGRYRLAVSLVDWTTNEVVWSDAFESVGEGLLNVRTALTSRVATALSIEPLGTQIAYPGGSEEALPHYLTALGLMGLAGEGAERLDRWSRAQAQLDSAVVIAPEFAAAWARLGLLGFRRFWLGADPSKDGILNAEAALLRAVALDPNGPETRLAQAYKAYHVDRDWAAAARQARELTAELNSDPDLAILWAMAERRRGNFEEAVRIMRGRITRDPLEFPILWWELFSTYLRLGRTAEADRLLAQAETMSGRWVCNARYARAYQSARTPRDLDLVVQECRARDPGSFRSANLFWHEFRMRRFDEAIAAIDSLEARRQARGETPDWINQQWAPFPTALWRVAIAQQSGDTQGAARLIRPHLSELERLVEEFPDLALRRAFLAQALAAAGQSDLAIREVEYALALSIDLNDLWYGVHATYESVMRIYADVGEIDRALSILEDHLTSGPSPYLTIGRMRLDPLLDPLRDQPRFVARLRAMEAGVGQ